MSGMMLLAVAALASVEPAGGRRIRVRDGETTAVLDVPPPTRTEVRGERYEALPVFDKDKAAYARGVTLKGVRAWGVSTRFALDPGSVTVKGPDGRPFERGRDWLMQEDWGCIGRVADGTIGSNVAVTVDYAYSPLRIDSVFKTPDGIVIRSGAPDISLPKIRETRAGERRLANIFVERCSDAIGDGDIFIPEEGPLPVRRSETPEAASKCPKVWDKLQRGEPVKILAWGDSVTACDYLPNRERARWQEQFAARLRRRFPKSKITVVTEGWSGYDLKSFLETDVTHVHSFERKVLDVNPDLVVSEFINDAWMKAGDVDRYYGRVLGEFQRRGFEWIICTPHYSRPDWMGLSGQKNCDRDPRMLVSALRLFTGKHGLCLADASRRWGHLWRVGVPYVSLLTNNINHPTAEGLKFFADALMELFGGDVEEPVVASPAFMMLRIGSAPEVDGTFLNEVWAGQRRSPGLFDEIWGSGCGTDPYAAVDTLVAEAVRINTPIAERCRELGIRFSYQQGMTLGHAPGLRPHPQVPDEVWAVDLDGRRMYGILCATSPFTWDFLRRKSEGIIRALQPASYWPDDDLRLDKHPPICFCVRCLELFSKRMSRSFTREELCASVFGNPGDERVRRAWAEFNAENVGRVAEAFRAARDAAKRDCRLGEQSAYSGQTYSGYYQRKVLEAFSGPSRDPVSMRAGAVYYMDRSPHELFAKQLDVAREAARCRRLGFVDQVCYEAEMWPHCGSMKAAGGEMMECAMALAAGCDSLAVYWGVSHNNEEAPEHCRYWVDTLIRWKPFLLAVRDVLEASELAGGAIYHGSRFHDLPEWGEGLGWSEHRNHDDPAVVRLIENAVPMSVQEGDPDFHVLNERAVRTLSESDLPEVFARPVLIDVRAFRTFVSQFPGHELSAAVDVRNDGQEVVAGAGARPRELIGDKRSLDVHGAYVAKAKGVRAFSSISGTEKGMGTCLVRLSSGVGVVLVQDIAECFFPWSGYCRRAILDALDEAVPGGVPVRLLTDGYCVSVTARKDAAGRAVGAMLLNASTGITPPLELSLRNQPDAAWMIRLPTADPICAKVVRRTDVETVIEIPELVPYQPILVYEK